MSSFINGIKLNNLNHKVNQLQADITALEAGTVPPIHGDLDMNNNLNCSALGQIAFVMKAFGAYLGLSFFLAFFLHNGGGLFCALTSGPPH